MLAKIEPNAAFDECSQSDVALENDQRSRVFPRQRTERQQKFRSGFRALVSAEEALSAETGQSPPDFRLKQHDDGDRGVRGKRRQQRPERLQAGAQRDFIGEYNRQNSNQNMRGASAAHNLQQLIDDERHRQDIDHGSDG